MAVYEVINKPGDYRTAQDVERGISYITSPWKVRPDGVFGGAVTPSCAADAMNCVTDAYHNREGVRLRHSVLSFVPNEGVSIEQAKEIAQRCISYYADSYQIIAAVHEDTPHPHIHFGMNTTSYVDGSKCPGTKSDYYNFLKHLNKVGKPYGVNVIAVKDQKNGEL